MTPVNIPITQVWPSGLTNTGGIDWVGSGTVDDPQPIDATIGILFNSGAQNNINSFTLYLRGNANVPVIESVINGQAEGNLNGFALANNSTLPSNVQTAEAPNAFNVQATLQWGKFSGVVGYQISLNNSFNPVIYQYNSLVSGGVLNVTALTNNTEYLFLITLVDESIEVSIFPVNSEGYLNASIFESAPIKDTSVFYRLPGHVGIGVNTLDTGAAVYSLRPFHTVFAAFESNTFNSITPVAGAQLFTQNTPPTQLFTPALTGIASSDGMTPAVTSDSGRTLSGESLKISFGESTATATFQGVVSDILTPIGDTVSGITDFDAIEASFDIWIESSAITTTDNPFIAVLVNAQGYGVPLSLPNIVPNKWNHGVINLLVNPSAPAEIVTEDINTVLGSPIPINGLIPTGLYQLVLMYTGQNATTVWLDNIEVTSQAIAWYGRATDSNPFIRDLATWIPFGDTVNTTNDGIRFAQPMSGIQVRAEALQQDAEIYNGYTLVPQYAELGNIVMNKTLPSIIPTTSSTSTPGIYMPAATSVGTNEYTFTLEVVPPTGNLIPNGGFHHDTVNSPPAGWTPDSSLYQYDVQLDSNNVPYLELSTEVFSAPGQSSGTTTTNYMPVTANTKYSFGGLINSGTGGITTVAVQWYNGTTLLSSSKFTSPAQPYWWEFLEQVISPSTATQAKVYIYGYSTVGFTVLAMEVYNIFLSPVGITEYVDGDTPGFGWSGTAGNSPTLGDGKSNVYNVEWSFGDGNYAYDQVSLQSPTISRTYQYTPGSPNIGQFSVTASVTDNQNNRGYATTIVSVT